MRRIHFFLQGLRVIAGLWLGLSASRCYAVSFTVSIDTMPLVGQAAGPFALDFN